MKLRALVLLAPLFASAAPDDVWAVGNDGSTDVGTIVHWNGVPSW
ncbi:MAG TPA: hypothetical protein VN903_28330 [Polyangia bacterium]|nr:hypothetical protein [Polyangia bacterium]